MARRLRGAEGRKVRERLDAVGDRLAPHVVRARLLELQRRIGLTRSGQLAVVAFVVLWLSARIIAGTAMYLFAYGLLIVVAASYFLAPRRFRLTAERTGLFPRVHEGDSLDVRLTLQAQRRYSMFMLEERVPERLGTTVRVPVAGLAGGAQVEHRYGLRCTRRGVYDVGPLVAVASDPIGLTARETVITDSFELLVHPRVELVSDRPLTRQFEDPPIRPPVSRKAPSGMEFYGMRPYVRGDDLRRIVWRATAKTGTLMVREAELGITDHITVILDTDRGRHSRLENGISESFETGIRVAASLGVRHLREGYEVTCETNAGPLTRPIRGGGAQLVLLDALTRVDMSREPLSSVIMRLVASPRRDAHNVLITPYLGEQEASRLKLLLDTGVSVLVVGLLWDSGDETADVLGTAISLGCQVVGVHPGQDLSTALYQDLGAGNR